jgi:tetratricopeptide (TPR) repeat protein
MAVVLLLVAAKFIGSHVLTAAAAERFEARRGGAEELDPLRRTNYYEYYKVFLNSGDLLYQRSRFRAAEDEFRRALALAEGSAACRARFNLVLTIRQQGKALIANRAFLSGMRRLEEAIATMDDAPECFNSSKDGKDGIADRYRSQRDALRAEVERAKRAQPIKPQESPSANAPPPGGSALERIEANEADASRAAQERKDVRSGGTLPRYDGPRW